MAKQQLTLAKFLETVEKSNLLEPGRLSAYCQDHAEKVSSKELAEHMVRDGLLTKFQADNLLKGRWGRYFIGPYKVLEKVGTGTNSQVYLCEHSKMKRRVAVKVLQADKAQDAEVLRRFEREAMAAAAVRHANIVHAYDLGVEDRLHYLVMEYVDGVSLLKKLADGGRLSPRQAAAYMRQAAAGLQVAHDAGVVHRDLKPSNLMITKDERLKVLDLGLARYAGDDTALTRGDAVLGLAAYIAPEQASNSHSVDGRADLYSLGATFYLAITGKKPPVYGKFDPPPARTPSEEPDYQTMIGVIKKMMALRPEERYQSAHEVIAVLDEMGCEIITTPAPLMVSPTAEPSPGRSGVTGYQSRTEPEQVVTTPAPVWTTPAPKPSPKPAPDVAETRLSAIAETVAHLVETPGPSVTSAELPLPKWGSSPGHTATPFGAAATAPQAHDEPLWRTLVKQTAPAPQAEVVDPAVRATEPKPWGKWVFLGFAVVAFLAAVVYTFKG